MAFIACGSENRQKQPVAQHHHWVCLQGLHGGAEIALARMGNVFRGEYIDPGFQDRFSIPIMGTIDDEGNVNGVSASTLSDELYGKLSGKITGNTFYAVWLPTPTPTAIGEFREMEMTLKKTSTEITAELNKNPDAFYNFLYPEAEPFDMSSGEYRSRVIPFLPETPYTAIAYGYSIGEWERRHIHIEAGSKPGETIFHLHIIESGINDTDVYITGAVQLSGNTFRYNEKGYQFEVAVYNGFITVKTITGTLDGVVADGIYPAQMEMSYYYFDSVAGEALFNLDDAADSIDPVQEQIRRDLLALPEMGFPNASVVLIVGPSEGQPYYIFKGGENMGTHLAEYFRFHVYVEPEYEIKLYDFGAGEMTLDEWRTQGREEFINKEVAGEWVRTDDNPDVSSAEIVISDVTPEGFLFSFSGSFVNPYGAYHFGELEEQTASFSSADTALFVYNDGDEPATVLFVFKEGKLIVSVADNCYLPDFGAGVRMEGEYVRK